jgi:NifU-like protein involved in Fe-S cluster formation
MSDPRYSAEVQRRLRELPGAGFPGTGRPGALGVAGDPEQGAAVEIELAIQGERVESAYFRAFGCPELMAAASWLTEWVKSRTREELESWDWREAAAALGVPPHKYGRLLTLQDALRDALGNWPGNDESTV